MGRWGIPLAVSITGTTLWWSHRVLTDTFPPFINLFDTTLHIIVSVLKLATIICIPFALARVFTHCHRDLRKTATAVAVWGGALVLLLAVLCLLRTPLTAHLNNDTLRFFPSSVSAQMDSAAYMGMDVQSQVARWQSGAAFLSEFALIIAALVILGLFAFFAGRVGLVTGVAAAVCVGLTSLVGSFALGLLVWDYDIFFAGTMIAPFSTDVIIPFIAQDPTSEIGFFVYTAIITSSYLLDTRLLNPAPALVQSSRLSTVDS